jgi:hypothetical protein
MIPITALQRAALGFPHFATEEEEEEEEEEVWWPTLQ